MKKIIVALLSAAMVLGLVACGGGTTTTAAPAETTTAAAGETATASDLNVGVFYYTFADTYISSVRDAVDKQLNGAGIKFENFDGNGDQKTQSEQVSTALAKGINMLVVNLVETSSLDAAQDIVSLAKEKNIPLLFFNREVQDEIIKSYDNAAFIGTDAAEAGHMQGKMIAEYLLADYDKFDLNKDGNISYIMFKGEMGNPEAEMRTQFGVEDADAGLTAAGKPALVFYDEANADKYLVDKDGQWSAKAANEYMTTVLANYNDANNNMVELVIANNDGMAEGAIAALEGAGYNNDAEKVIPVFGVDATDAAKDLISKGKMAGTIKQDAEGMAAAIAKLCASIKDGKGLLEDLGDLQMDAGVSKIRIPYQVYLGE